MDGDSDRSAKHRKPAAKAIRRCAICGSTAHTAGHHDSTVPGGYHDSAPIEFATEEVVIEDDDRR
jgi:hypothetical protein